MAPQRPRNVLLLWSDEQRPDTIGAYGNLLIKTPNLDRLAATGVLFEQAYCTQPACSPSRASVLTGVYPHTHGVTTNSMTLPATVPTIAELLRGAASPASRSGLACGYIGKWHLGYEHTPQRGFEDWWTSTEAYRGGYAAADPIAPRLSSYDRFLQQRGVAPPGGPAGLAREAVARLPEEVGKPAFQAAEAIRFLETYRDRPYLLSVNFLEPHPPYFGPWDDMYRAEDMTLPRSWYQGMEETVPLRYRRRREDVLKHGHKGRVPQNDERDWKGLKARYWGLASLVDKYVGQILDRLEKLGLAENTIVIYTSDHGEMMGEHRLLNKGLQYEGSVRVPLIIRVPGVQPRRVATPVSQVHLVPTLLSLLDQPIPAHVQGTDLGPLLASGNHAPEESEVVIEWSGYVEYPKAYASGEPLDEPPEIDRLLRTVEARTIRRGRWKLNVHLSGENELYDLDADPGELHNAFYDRGNADVVQDLFERLLAWQRDTGDTLALPNVAAAVA